MNLDRTANHPVRQLVKFQPPCSFVLFVVKSVFLFSLATPDMVPDPVVLLVVDGAHFQVGLAVDRRLGSLNKHNAT